MSARVLLPWALCVVACDATAPTPTPEHAATVAPAADPAPRPGPAADPVSAPAIAPAPASAAKAVPPAITPPPVAAPPVAAPPVAPEAEPTAAYEERLAGLGLGMTVAQLQAVRPALVRQGEPRQVTPNSSTPGPTSYYSQELRDGAVTVEVRAKTLDAVQRAASIAIDFDGTDGTSKGIAIGTPLAAFRRAYPKAFRPMPRQLPDEYWVPFAGDEMLFVLVERGKVYSMQLGETKRVEDIEL